MWHFSCVTEMYLAWTWNKCKKRAEQIRGGGNATAIKRINGIAWGIKSAIITACLFLLKKNDC